MAIGSKDESDSHLFCGRATSCFRSAQGELIFQGDASFLGCYSQTDEAEEISRGGAFSNTAPGIIHIMGDLTMEKSEADVSAKYELFQCKQSY